MRTSSNQRNSPKSPRVWCPSNTALFDNLGLVSRHENGEIPEEIRSAALKSSSSTLPSKQRTETQPNKLPKEDWPGLPQIPESSNSGANVPKEGLVQLSGNASSIHPNPHNNGSREIDNMRTYFKQFTGPEVIMQQLKVNQNSKTELFFGTGNSQLPYLHCCLLLIWVKILLIWT